MKVPIKIKYSKLEEECYWDDWEDGVVCNDLETIVETQPEYVEFDREDIEKIITLYPDDIINVIVNNKRFREALMKKLNSKGEGVVKEGEEDN